MKTASLRIVLILFLTAGSSYAQLSNTSTATATFNNPAYLSVNGPGTLFFNNGNQGPNQPASVNGMPVTGFFNININYGGLVGDTTVNAWIVSPNPLAALTNANGNIVAAAIEVIVGNAAPVALSTSVVNPLGGAAVLLGSTAAINGSGGNNNWNIDNIYLQINKANQPGGILPVGPSTGVFNFIAAAT